MIKYVQRQRVVDSITNGEVTKSMKVVIEEQLVTKDGYIISMPSSLTEFITLYYGKKAISTRRNVGIIICGFLNYVKSKVTEGEDEDFFELKKEGLFGLELIHASKYLNYCSSELKNSLETVEQKENILINFYSFIVRKKILNNKKIKIDYKIVKQSSGSKGKRVYLTPFDDPNHKVIRPSKKRVANEKRKNMSKKLWKKFLELAEEKTPDIAFGIALQIMGGIRRGEAVNLLLEDVTVYNEYYDYEECANETFILELNITDRTEELFTPRGIQVDTSSPKKHRRNQPAFDFDDKLNSRWNMHLKLRSEILERTNKKTNALFVDKYGNPMSGNTYRKRFNKVKDVFLYYLKENSYSEYKKYLNAPWSTHIGRGIFSNICVEIGLANINGVPNKRILANLRGDDNSDSCKDYIDDAVIIDNAQSGIKLASRLADDDDDIM
ncbi:hypothetical protein [Paraclostridium bifermentans]|uniref:hypothetical protein n=1 Tax=Paraclostridium bifermentans TaxID=1490 RepID=UPI001FF34CF5|nr:hypothetical protein [Paraclostridium bifermentans]UOW66788.1 hypothetical protein MTR78_09515 [Paraclostridium bifermentans]